MMLAGTSFEQIKTLIDRGVASDHSFPKGQAYLLSTSDRARNSRAAGFAHTAKDLTGVFSIQILQTDAISDHQEVLFYFTGLAEVPMLPTPGFLPGALADHLTSAGGMLTDSLQMSSLLLTGSRRHSELWHRCRALQLSTKTPITHSRHVSLGIRRQCH